MSIDLTQDYFALFGLPRRYALDEGALEAAWHELQGRVHPDRHAHLSDFEKRRSMQWATRVNEGFRVLRKPLARAQYLLELAGVDAALSIVVSLLAQRGGQACLQLAGADALWASFAAHQLAEAEGIAPAIDFFSPFFIEPASFIQDKEDFEVGLAKLYIRRFLAAAELVEPVCQVERQ